MGSKTGKFNGDEITEGLSTIYICTFKYKFMFTNVIYNNAMNTSFFLKDTFVIYMVSCVLEEM